MKKEIEPLSTPRPQSKQIGMLEGWNIKTIGIME